MRQILERLDKDEQEIKDLRSQLANRPAAPSAAIASNSPGAQWQQRIEQDETVLTNLNSEISEKNLAEQKAIYPNLQFHGFGDVDYAADNRRPKNVPGNAHGVPYGRALAQYNYLDARSYLKTRPSSRKLRCPPTRTTKWESISSVFTSNIGTMIIST